MSEWQIGLRIFTVAVFGIYTGMQLALQDYWLAGVGVIGALAFGLQAVQDLAKAIKP